MPQKSLTSRGNTDMHLREDHRYQHNLLLLKRGRNFFVFLKRINQWAVLSNFLSCENCFIVSYAFRVTNAHFIRENICIKNDIPSEEEFED